MKALCHTRKCYLTPHVGARRQEQWTGRGVFSSRPPTVPAPSRPHKTVTFLTLTLDCIKHQVILSLWQLVVSRLSFCGPHYSSLQRVKPHCCASFQPRVSCLLLCGARAWTRLHSNQSPDRLRCCGPHGPQEADARGDCPCRRPGCSGLCCATFSLRPAQPSPYSSCGQAGSGPAVGPTWQPMPQVTLGHLPVSRPV